MVTEGSRRVSTALPPRTLQVQKFAESRASELDSLHSIVSNRWNDDFKSRRNKRRRTTSHDNRASRVRFRKKQKLGAAEDSNKDSGKAVKRAPPRHIRRRKELSENPQSGFVTSGDGTKRLRTHVWHAKRFTMTKRWGFHLPLGLHGRGRGSRAVLKWLKNGVVIHDASYQSAVQLEGTEDVLLSILGDVMMPSPKELPQEFSHKLLSGVAYARSMLHHCGQLPSGMIAPVTYMWRPCHKQVNNVASFRKLWVWIHAAAFKEGFNALEDACRRQGKVGDNTPSVNCISLEGQLSTLEVMGSKASQLLHSILRPVASMLENVTFAEALSENSSLLDDQASYSGLIYHMVNDPRSSTCKALEVPEASFTSTLDQDVTGHKNLEGVEEGNTKLNLLQCSKSGEYSTSSDCMDLWNASRGLCCPLEESALCVEKHQQRLSYFCLDDKSSRELNVLDKRPFSRFCPIILFKSRGTVTRWSILLPLSWAKAFWIPLVSCGGRPIGLREKRWIACDSGLPSFPSDFPCTHSYSTFMSTESAIADQNASLRPPSVRPLRVPIPPPWDSIACTFEKKLIKTEDSQIQLNQSIHEEMVTDNITTQPGCEECDRVVVGSNYVSLKGDVPRTSTALSRFANDAYGDPLLLFPNIPSKRTSISQITKDGNCFSEGTDMVRSVTNTGKAPCFLRVHLHACKEGVFEEGAVVCAPLLTDITLWTSRSDSGNAELQMPPFLLASYFLQQPSGKWELQIPEDPVAMESHRWPIGFVTTGFVRGSKKPSAVALCEAFLLSRLRAEQWNSVPSKRRRKEIYVLVRNLRSTAYRLALASIVLEQREEDLDYL